MTAMCEKEKGTKLGYFDSPNSLKPRKYQLIFTLPKGRLPNKHGGIRRYRNATAKTRSRLPKIPFTD